MSLKARVTVSMLSLVAISGGVSSLVGGYLLHKHLSQEAENRVRQDLNAAREFYAQRIEAMTAALRYTAIGERFSQAVAEADTSYLEKRLAAVRHSARLDTLCVTDARGRAIYRAQSPADSGDSLAADRLVGAVLHGEEVVSGTLLSPLADLVREGAELVERARIPLLPTPRAKPSTAGELDAGMMLGAAVAVHGADGRLAGVLRAGTLLSRNYELVDQVQNTVFRGERYGGKLLGTATVFQDDVRVSTNVLLPDGSRAIGSRVSAEVYDCVLRQETPWVGRAWVVSDWYISAYAPIYDPDDRPVGMLYVGVLERKYQALIVRTLTIFGLVTFVGLLAAGAVAWKLADSIARPVSTLARAASTIAEGNLGEILPVESSDEIGSLTRAFNIMSLSLKEHDDLLREQTRLQLTRSERLASVGRLAAGVAHEINNPLTGVLTFAHLLHDTAPEGSQERKDLETILEATLRCKDIVRGLLNFSRQNEPQKRLANLNEVLRSALNLTRNQARIHQVAVVEGFAPALPLLVIDPNQIQEVAVNGIVNAIDAMPDGGQITVRSRAVEVNGAPWTEFEIADTGCGIPPENLDRVFDPFFTTKQTGKGTGLGLAVSYGIVTEHGGQIRIASEVGHGATLTVRLPASPPPPAPAPDPQPKDPIG
ncbi:MAG TPA: cache domain-containing protein [Planctomycetota bacterium]|nr:cache domain-containing protein [Planctomycetota bacterium]